MRTKIIVGLIFIAFGAFMYVQQSIIVDLNKANAVMQVEVKQAKDSIAALNNLDKKIDVAVTKLEANNNEREKLFNQFAYDLKIFKNLSKETQAVLRTIVPRDALTGLRSFRQPQDSSGPHKSTEPLNK